MAFSFNGTNQSLSATSFISGFPFTIACWLNPTSPSTADTSLGGFSVTSVPNNIHMLYLLTGKLGAYSYGSPTEGWANGTTILQANQWAHGAAVFTSSTSRSIYVNGTLEASNTVSIDYPASNVNFSIGSYFFGGSRTGYFSGKTAESAVWNVALTALEIASLASGFTPNLVRPQSLQFYAPLISNLQDVRNATSITNINAATVATHPRVYT